MASRKTSKTTPKTAAPEPADAKLIERAKAWAKNATLEELANALARSRGLAYKLILEEYRSRKTASENDGLAALVNGGA